MSKNVQTDEQALQNFLLDIQCLDELLPWTGKFNLFDVLKISRTEIRHSNVLGWLLDPNENHGFGDAFLKGMFQRIVENDTEGKYDIFGVLLSDMYSFIVRREWNNIDILLTSSDEKIVLAIENKVGSQEHSNQLSRYSKIIEKKYPNFNRIYIYLTPEGGEPKDVENWDILSYKDIVEVLEDIMNRIKLQPDVSVMVNNYINVIRRNILEDQQLIEICNKIYNKHKRALDLIFEHRDDADDFVILCKRLSQAEEALCAVKGIMKKLELTLHSEKTRLVDMYFGKDSFDFLGFNNRFQRFRNKSWQWYWTLQQVPSKKAMKKMRANIKEVFASSSKLLLSMEEMVKVLNPKIIGMRNYYTRRFARPWLWKIDKYINFKFTRWYNRKKQRNYRLGNAAKVRELTLQAGLASICG